MKNTHFRTLCLVAALIGAGSLAACSSKTAEEKGAELAGEKLDMAKGIGDAMGKKGEAATEAVVGGLGTMVKGIKKGTEKSGRSIEADATVATAGLKITRVQDAQRGGEGSSNGLDLYVIGDKEASGKLRVLMYDVLGNEVARATIDIVRAADDARYERLALDEKVSLSAISRLAISFKPGTALAQK